MPVSIPSTDRALWLARAICPHEPALRRWLSGRSHFACDIDDIVQESYARLATLPAVDHITNPRAYFFQTAFSILANEIRRAQVVPIDAYGELDQLGLESQDPPPDACAEGRQELRLLAAAIAQLPGRRRDAFILRKVNGLSQREAAEHLGIAESTLEKHIAAGLRQIATILGKAEDGGNRQARVSSIEISVTEQHGEARNE